MASNVRRLSSTLRNVFQIDGRYVFAHYVGSGAQGTCYKLNRVQPQAGDRTSLLLKVLGGEVQADDDDDEISPEVWAEAELNALQIVRGASHVIQMVDILRDPLTKASAFNDLTIPYLELAYRPAPSRIVGLTEASSVIRSTIACAWPTVHQPDVFRLEEPQAGFSNVILKNFDIHDENLMFGAFSPVPVPEHFLAPPIIMIDLGITDISKNATEVTWNASVREMLDQFMAVLSDLTKMNRSDEAMNTRVDPDIRKFLSIYEADPKAFPILQDIFTLTFGAVRDRSEAWYAANVGIMDGSESDDNIRTFVQTCILSAHTDGNQTGFHWG
ncbi:hypothetical protein JX265_007410 [Neoarthrinium moseri]|uniref:Uncharacterized protein n=1 Tax=Neoarthrinium moseri TaxID=1658444 RepID=A0A9P9WKE2_9PEZI|nr:hypothetical protein JX266_010257 [Neoarthrinium moseri]KAI1867608.1 hypothetical protein JX265_007410 [Neoarthrinium moseri]